MKHLFSQSCICLRLALLLAMSLVFSCSREPPSTIHEALDEVNDVSRLGVPIDFTSLIQDLPAQGDSLKFIWNGNWYPLSEGGTLVATRKYDRAIGKGRAAEEWEAATVRIIQILPGRPPSQIL